MSIRNLDKLFTPRSVALIGATPRPGSVGVVVARNLRRAGFASELMLVNPHHPIIDGLAVYPNVASLPQTPDLAVIVTPPETIPPLIGELGEKGTRAAVVITAGFGELGEQGRPLQRATLDAAKPHLLRIVGANCVATMDDAPHYIAQQRGIGVRFVGEFLRENQPMLQMCSGARFLDCSPADRSRHNAGQKDSYRRPVGFDLDQRRNRQAHHRKQGKAASAWRE